MISRLFWHEITPDIKYFHLKNITKEGVVVVCRSIISNYLKHLRKMTTNYVNNDVMWGQKWETDYFDMK